MEIHEGLTCLLKHRTNDKLHIPFWRGWGALRDQTVKAYIFNPYLSKEKILSETLMQPITNFNSVQNKSSQIYDPHVFYCITKAFINKPA